MLFAEKFRNARNRDRSSADAYRAGEDVCEICPRLPLEDVRRADFETLLLIAAEAGVRACSVHFRTRASEAESVAGYERVIRLCLELRVEGIIGGFYGFHYPGYVESSVIYIDLFQISDMPSEDLIPAEQALEAIASLGYKQVKSGA